MVPLFCMLFLVAGALANPVTQPVYSNQQYVAQPQQLPPQYQYRQLSQAQLLAAAGVRGGQAHPVFEQPDLVQQPQYVAQQAQPLVQPLLSHADRQVQKAAHHIAGPNYAQQIQALQLQGQAEQAQAQLQRNALRLATAPRAQPLQYQRALQSSQPAPKLLQQSSDEGELQEQYNSNPSYQFGFDVKDDLYTNYQNRKEQRDGDKIKGSYSVVDSDGYIRTVTYTADPKQGFKAEVTREPTDIVVKFPQPRQQQQAQPQIEAQQHQIQRQQAQQPQYIEVPVQQQAASGQGKQPRIVYQYQ